MKISYRQIENVITQFAIILTILSFSPNEFIVSLCETTMFLFWGGVVLFKIVDKQLRIDNSLLWMIIVYTAWFVCTKLFHNFGFYPSGGLGVAGYIPYCVVFYIIGLNFDKAETNIKGILNAFFVGETLLMITLLPYLSEISESRYAFNAKNQMGQMLGTGIILGFFILFQEHKSFFFKIAILLMSSMSLMSLLIIGSRTPLIAIIVIAITSFTTKKERTSKDYLFVLAIVVAIGITISYLGGINYVLELFDLNDSTGVDIDNMTSGRFTLYAIAMEDFISSPFIGLGAWAYIDNFIINILRCGGLLLLVLILPVSYGKMFSVYKKTTILSKTENGDVLSLAAKYMVIFYFVVSLMEGYPPLGPNTSVFFLWILIGIVSGKELPLDAAE